MMPGSPPPDPAAQISSGPLRRLLPAVTTATTASPSSTSSPSSSCSSSVSGAETAPRGRPPGLSPGPPVSSTPLHPLRKRQATTAACSACRRRKSKCNGQRPRCSVCRDRGTECEFDTNATETHAQALKRKYSELQSQKTTYQQIFSLLQTRPEQEAEDLLQRIRRGADANSILRHVNYGDVLVQLALVPEARYRYEFPYKTDMPEFLLRPDNPYLDSELYELALRTAPDSPGSHHRHQRRRLLGPGDRSSSSPDSTPDAELQSDPYVKPFHAATVVHPLLDTVRPSRWTSVSSDDNLMRKLLHEYFLHEYDYFTFFHKEYFLEDMASGRLRFCSQLLTNTVLCVGCYCHKGLRGRAEFWNPKNLGYQFLAEAKRLFELEADLEQPDGSPGDPEWERRCEQWEDRRLTTIQAALFLNIICAFNGSDKIGWRYTLRAIEMASEIQLFRKPRGNMSPAVQCVRSFTAWSIFCWQSLMCYHYFRLPPMRDPPESTLPDPAEEPEWYGEGFVRYPLTPEPRLPTYHPLFFKAKTDLYLIVNEYSLFAYGRHNPQQPLAPRRVLWFYNRLVAWFKGLPEPLSPRRIVMPHQIMLHMHYNLILTAILKPILSQDWGENTQALSDKSPYQAYANAAISYETTMRLYYLRHGFEGFDSFLVNFLGSLSQMAIDAMEANPDASTLDSLVSTVLLAAKGLHDQGRCHYVATAALRLQVSLMRPRDVELLKRFVKIGADEGLNGPLRQPTQSDWPAYGVVYEESSDKQKSRKSLTSRLESLSLEPTSSPTPSASSR
ncbi:hypothetical protein B0H67DRAFT_32036 [Lasiosphaeris hirsuta]|uniref:Zn(2)-C6 fungal-type domain-containing protein n=1 Tax=Lasiosphaeris hirsuta TaxID=260670 RepID=A0AA40BAG6_9PEZI|nr:hypothetical protein B0H67DRAFT_32036 [Lasiosphaeris hirsuta]